MTFSVFVLGPSKYSLVNNNDVSVSVNNIIVCIAHSKYLIKTNTNMQAFNKFSGCTANICKFM